jgi:hypothetical protein
MNTETVEGVVSSSSTEPEPMDVTNGNPEEAVKGVEIAEKIPVEMVVEPEPDLPPVSTLLECAFCKARIFPETPYLMSCFHTVCSACLAQIRLADGELQIFCKSFSVNNKNISSYR